jgi:hypothetical protein
LAGIDVARCVALLGMASVHVLPTTDEAGAPTLLGQVFSGRAAALFAVLAGVGLALAVGPRPELGRAAPVLAARAGIIGAIGLLLALFDSGVAVILPYYAVLFVLVLPWLRARPPVLLASAAAIAVGMPLLSFAVRDSLPPRDPTNPGPWDLAAPGELLSELLLTGYYPAAVWVAYLLTGLAVARIGLRSRRTAALLAACGAALALAAHATSALLLGPLGGYRRIGRSSACGRPTRGRWSTRGRTATCRPTSAGGWPRTPRTRPPRSTCWRPRARRCWCSASRCSPPGPCPGCCGRWLRRAACP